MCFVGNLFPGPRTDLLRLVQQYFPRNFVGHAYFDQMAAIYSAAKIVFNRSLVNDVNMRVFEALASGSLVMTNDLTENGLPELFRDGVHLATYTSGEDLLEKLRYYLQREELRERIAAAGRAEVVAKHTYLHRVRQILEVVSVGWDKRSAGPPMELRASRIANGDLAGAGHDAPPATHDPSPPTQNAQLADCRDRSDLDFSRPVLLALIPPSAGTILDVGCGDGCLGQALKARQPCEVIGIERDEQAAAVARSRYDLVLAGDVEQMEITNWDGYFDAVVLGGVLQQFRDAAKQLQRIRSWLKADGRLILSVANVREHNVVRGLLAGNWTYQPAGITNATQRSFFTSRTIQRLLGQCGFCVEHVAAVPTAGYDEWERAGRPDKITIGGLHLDGPPEQIQEYFVYQWLVVAGKAKQSELTAKEPEVRSQNSEGGKQTAEGGQGQMTNDQGQMTVASAPHRGTCVAGPLRVPRSRNPLLRRAVGWPGCVVLMVTHDRLEYTKLSLESLLAQDYPNLRIVVFENGSSDQTPEYLTERLRNEPRARIILSPVNRGVVYPMNEVWFGDNARFPEGGGPELLVKVDSDTLVPPDLLWRLAEGHMASDRFGALAGFHFREEGAALIDDRRIEEFDGAKVVRQRFVGGCAVMIKKATLERFGPIPCRTEGQAGPFMDGGWTGYQERMTAAGLVNGYVWPLVHVDHME
ncbi:MAG TPA: glycosyltransferase, partial [Pirellulales bacterium]|nr:glycosyltransferase [Pirellulales bacterium]